MIHNTNKTKHNRGRHISTDTLDRGELTIHDIASPFVPDPFAGGGGDIVVLTVFPVLDLSFELSKLWKKCCSTSCCVCPVGLGLGTDGEEAVPRPEALVPVTNEPTVRVLRESFRDISGPLVLALRFML